MIITAIKEVYMILIYSLTRIIPTKDEYWAFSSRNGSEFCDNPKYLFLYVSNSDKFVDVSPAYFTYNSEVVSELKSNGYTSYDMNTIRGKYRLLLSKYIILSHGYGDIRWWLCGNSKFIQLWHGVSFKKKGLIDDKMDRNKILRKKFRSLLGLKQYEKLIITSSDLVNLHTAAFGLSKEDLWITGYPRYDIFFREVQDYDIGTNSSWYIRAEELYEESTVLMYLPTWRDTGRDPLTDGTLNYEELQIKLSELDTHLLIKPHPYTETASAVENKDNIHIIRDLVDVYPILEFTDALITDYSSVFSDYLLLDRPIIFYAYDLDKFTSEDRDLYFDYEEYTPGPVIKSQSELLTEIEKVTEGIDQYVDDRTQIREEFHDYSDGCSAQRVADRIHRLE
ncbi:CDP-glycerol glycerophosphotransferase family protein [Halorubrum sp. FL23]|uniref:CDP-glycerol glycerophosphotransferase family protein n=1 Tax=Halorubrum sp. FL23 TaxID=3458704 RepID=UPI00403425B1